MVSAGGLTETLVKASTGALLAHVRSLQAAASQGLGAFGLVAFARALVAVYTQYAGDDRVVVPLMRTLDRLFADDLLSDIDINAGADLSFLQFYFVCLCVRVCVFARVFGLPPLSSLSFLLPANAPGPAPADVSASSSDVGLGPSFGALLFRVGFRR